MFKIKRAYEPVAPEDGFRVLVDRSWPRGLSRKAAAIDEWLKEIAPPAELLRWFGRHPDRWPEFRALYRLELRRTAERTTARKHLRAAEREKGTVTLLFGARDESHNHAAVLVDVLTGPP